MKRNNVMKRIALVVLGAYLNVTSAHAFEVTTHGAITREAWLRFLTGDPGVFDRLGIRDVDDAFGTISYFDYRPADGTAPVTRNSVAWYEDDIMKNRLDVPPFSTRGWLIRGAIREDDDSAASDPSPKEDPYGDFHRVFSHFHDPVNNSGLTVPVLGQLGARAADWALDPAAVTPVFVIPFVESTPRRFNNFSLATFRESLWRAVTGQNQAGEKVATTAGDRNTYWATAFRALGDILHLNQDMAQPQHTRNDPHAGGLFSTFTGHKSVFERYVDARIRGQDKFSTKDDANAANVSINPLAISFGNYPIPLFTQYADYWTRADQKGLADYSNRGFFSIGTLGGTYASPSTNKSDYTQQSVPLTHWDGSAYSVGYPSTLYLGNVPDAQEPTLMASNQPLFANSLWDDAAQGASVIYAGTTLTKSNYDAAINLLMPRAAAYSAGLLQYALRGRLEINPPDEAVYALVDHSQPSANTKDTGGFSRIKLKVRNTTPPLDQNGLPTTELIQGSGTLMAVVKFRRNTCYEAVKLLGQPGAPGYDPTTCKTGEEEITVSGTTPATPAVPDAINSQNGQAVTFNFPTPVPINATDVYLQVVYRGQLGTETDAVMVATKDISEPSFYNFDNYSDCYLHADGTYSTVTGQPQSTSMSFNGGVTYNAQVTSLPPDQYVRFALLADNYAVSVLVQGASGSSFPTVVNQQFGVAVGVADPTLIEKARPTAVPPASDNDYVYAYSGFGYYPYKNGDGYLGAQGCPTPIPAAPVPMTITFQ
ncbi:MAG TPA: hypothetical protein VEN78_34380 [Bradyrhizobium sp.]|nr:hypothetical protein [Bradyrhizobium sp.]